MLRVCPLHAGEYQRILLKRANFALITGGKVKNAVPF